MLRSSTVKVGFVAVLSIAMLVGGLIWLRGRGIQGGEIYNVVFADVDGLREGAPVQMMGIRVGFVDSVIPDTIEDKYRVRVKFSINHPDIEVPEGAVISIQQSGIIGEKFIEIMPPLLQEVTLSTFQEPAQSIEAGMPVKFLYESGLLAVGQVESIQKFRDENMVRHKLFFRITRPGAQMPENPIYELKLDGENQYYLLVLPDEPTLSKAPEQGRVFTVEEPLRMNRFLEIQLESAEALRTTNLKLSQLLSDENIATLSSTVKNTEVLTARATDVLDHANELFQVAGEDIDHLMKTTDTLAQNLIVVSNNLNEVIGNQDLKDDIVSTVDSIERSARALSDVVQDPALKETITIAKNTTRDASELVSLLKETAQDRDIQQRLDRSLTLLTQSLEKLNVVLDEVESITADEDDTSVKAILKDTREAADNLKGFSEKLDGHFTLFRLLF